MTASGRFYRAKSIASAEQNTWRVLDACRPIWAGIPGGAFLDIGCYTGEKTAPIAEQLHAKKVFGVDIHAVALAEAMSKHSIASAVVNLNGQDPLPFPDETFDCVHAGEVIEHLFSPDHLLKEMRRVLKKNGYGVITTPNLASWRNRMILLAGWQPFGTEVSTLRKVGNPMADSGEPVGHLRLFTFRALQECLAIYGLKIIKWRGWSAAGYRFPFRWLFRLLDGIAEKYFPQLCDGLIVMFIKDPTLR